MRSDDAGRSADVAGPGPPWQFLVRTAAVVVGLTLLLVVNAHGVAFYIAWILIVLAVVTEGVATLAYRRRAGRRP